jgi:hypothetical protein
VAGNGKTFNMTPKEKADELTEKCYQASRITMQGANTIFWGNAKNVAMITVDEILKGEHLMRLPLSYWQEVKKELL